MLDVYIDMNQEIGGIGWSFHSWTKAGDLEGLLAGRRGFQVIFYFCQEVLMKKIM